MEKVNINRGWLGCFFTVVGIILLLFTLTHIGPIWADLTRLVG